MRFRVSTGWAVAVLLASVGCGKTADVSNTGSGAGGDDAEGDGGGVMGLDFAESGSRLVALGYSSNEARLFRTFHDTQLGFDCDFVPDGTSEHQRCVPSSEATVIYTDAACTEPAAWDYPQFERGDAVSGARTDGSLPCPGEAPPHREAYRVGERLSEEVFVLGPTNLFEFRNSQCQEAHPPAKTVPAVDRLIPLAESDLVRGDPVSLNLNEGLRLTRLIADDGAALNLGVTSADRTPCALQRDGECVPEPIAQPSWAVDDKFGAALNADCTKPAFVAPPYSSACRAAKFGVEDDGVLPPKVRLLEKATALFSWEMVQPVTDTPSYTCAALPTAAEWLSAPGSDLTGTFPTASKLRRGSGSLHVDWFSVGQSELLPMLAGFQFANDAGQPCQISPADDGTLRCAVFDGATGLPIADLTTFPEVVEGPL